jgi:hypothetical protein
VASGALSGQDLYLSGTDFGAVLWKNGVATKLPRGYQGLNVFLTGTDVYVAGSAQTVAGQEIAAYWKNGKLTILGDSTKSTFIMSRAQSMIVIGSDVHVVGWEVTTGTGMADSVIARYWKNGKVVKLPTTSSQSYAGTIAVSGQDVYIGGNDKDGQVARVWKNGAIDTSFSSPGGILKIAVFNSDVYIMPTGVGGTSYWKNGNPVQMGGTTAAQDIVPINNDLFVVGLAAPAAATPTYFPSSLYENGKIVSPFDGSDVTVFLQGVLVAKK